MSKVEKLYAIVETDDDGNEKFFNDLLKPTHYNKSYQIRVYKNKKSADKRLAYIVDKYNNTNSYYSKDYREVGDLSIKEFTANE